MKRLLMITTIFLSVNTIAQEGIEKNLGHFNEIKVYDMINVELVKYDENKVIISGDNKNDVELINQNGILKIKMRLSESFVGNKTIVRLYYNGLDVIDVNEGAYVSSEDLFEQDKMELRAQEGGLINLKVHLVNSKIKVVTGGEIEVSGRVGRQDISVNTGGIFKGKSMESETTYVAIRAAGEAHINASRLADIKIRAGGDVFIYGNPETINENRLFGGRIKRMH